MKETSEFDAMVNRVGKAINSIPHRAGALAVNFSKDRFRAGNWVNTTREPWAKRKEGSSWSKRKERPGRAILVDRGRLRRSIRVVSVSAERVVIGTDVPYARAHNEGFEGKITQQVRAHTRNKKGRVDVYNVDTRKRSSRTTSVGSIAVKAHSRTINQKLPQRRFIGNSVILERQLNRMITIEIQRAIKNI